MFARKDDRRHKDCKGLTESGPLHCRASCGGGIASEPDTGSSMARSWGQILGPDPGARSWGQVLGPDPGIRPPQLPKVAPRSNFPGQTSQAELLRPRLLRPNLAGQTSPVEPRPNFTLRQDAIFPRSSERCRSSSTNLAASCRHATPRASPRGRYCTDGGCDGTTPSTQHLVRL